MLEIYPKPIRSEPLENEGQASILTFPKWFLRLGRVEKQGQEKAEAQN